MGISVSASVGIIFISIMISSVMVWEAHDTKNEMVDGARDRNLERTSSLLCTSAAVGNVSYFLPPANRVNIIATNNGSTALDLRYTDIYLNGTHYNKTYTLYAFNNEQITNSYILGPNDWVNITVTDVSLTPPIHMKLSFHNGYSLYGFVK